MDKMKGINAYFRQLSSDEITHKAHRDFVGGMWDELGQLQLEYMISSGLRPEHKLLDIGCGSMRGGIHFVRYLDEGNYFGMDINQSLIDAGKTEIEEAGLVDKKPSLIVDDNFSFGKFNTKFDFMISVSVFTHLPVNMIVRCLINARECLSDGGHYHATYFEAPVDAHLDVVAQEPGGIITNYDSDPFHYSVGELEYMAKLAMLDLNIVGDWNHPRNQKMAVFGLQKQQ